MWKDDLFCRKADSFPRRLVAEVCGSQQGCPVLSAQEEGSVNAMTLSFQPADPVPASVLLSRPSPAHLGSLMAFPAVDVSAEQGPQSESSSGLAGMLLSASGPLLPRPLALMRCCLGSFQLLV